MDARSLHVLCEKEKQLDTSKNQGIHACVLYHGREQWLQHILRLIESEPLQRERIAILVPEMVLEETQSTIQQYTESANNIEFGIVEDLFTSWAEINVSLCESRLERAIARCVAEGYDGLRIIVDMNWLADSSVSAEQVEASVQTIDAIVCKNPLNVFAGFDRQLFSSRRLLNLLPLYPRVWLNGSLSENIYHINSHRSDSRQLRHEVMLDFVLGQFDLDAGKLERPELESALRLLKQIIDSMGDGVIVTDADGDLLLINKTASEIIGYTHSDLPLSARVRTFGNYLPDKVTPYPLEELPITRALRGERVDQAEIFIRNELRTEGRWVSATGRPLRDLDGEIRGGVVVIRDITQKKHSEELKQQLEARMLQTQKLESLGLLAGGIAHDFNNLLMGILGHAGLAVEHASAENAERIQHIQKTAMHLSELTNQLLDFAGRGSFANRPTDIQRLVCELCGMIQPILSKKAALELDFSEESLVVLADGAQLRQVLMNLVTNASDALGEDPGSITIATTKRNVSQDEISRAFLREGLQPGEFVSICVSDTGAGISQEKLQKIFDPFFTTKTKGRGLGLAAVLGLVRRHGGALLVESELGKGTSFEVLLPPSLEALPEEVPPLSTEKCCRAPGKVLIIDDEEIVRSVAQQILEFAGYTVELAASGQEGLAMFAQQSEGIDAILLDVSMPDMDGREVFSRLLETRSDVKIVLSSGYTESEMLNGFPAGDLAGFLQKPYSPEKLIELLQQIQQ